MSQVQLGIYADGGKAWLRGYGAPAEQANVQPSHQFAALRADQGQGAAVPTTGVVAAVPIAGLLLAAGAGRRYGMPKALVEVQTAGGSTELLVQRAVRTLREGGCDPIVVVLGAGAELVPPLPDAHVVHNQDWESGQGSSLRAGLAALPANAVAVAVLLVDTPGITPDAVRRVSAEATTGSLRMATYGGAIGHPVLLGRAHWAGAGEAAVGDRGARDYLARTGAEPVPCDDISDGFDMDVPDA